MSITPPLPDGLRGLTTADAARKRAEHGRNELAAREHRSRLQVIASVLREPMLVLLLGAIAIYLVFGDLAEAIALGVSLLVIITITILQERRAERALDALRELASPHARVIRDGAWTELDARELVPGDLIHVAEGDRVPADAVMRAGTPLAIDESLLTGESVPVLREPDHDARALGRPGELGASIFAGTLVTSGNAIAEVMHIGARTQVGQIGAALGDIELARAPLQREVGRVVRRIAVLAVAVCLALVAIQLATGHGWLEGVLAGITLAMSLLPEELPLVLTIFLTLGAWRIARHQVLARRASAIETLGAVTVLCVDKTGTLTQNKMAIRRIDSGEVYDVDPRADELPESEHEVIEFGLLACPQRTADPMDHAFAALASRTLATTEHVHPDWRWMREYPLSPGLLAVTHVWRAGGDRTVIATKGAPEAILDLCHLDDATAAIWRDRAEQMAESGLRVLGVARAYGLHRGESTATSAHAYAFELVGLVGLGDPLRDETADTIAACRRAGVRVVMITGDHPTTARAIGRAAGLATDEILTGADVEAMATPELAAVLARTEVIARAAPAHKLRIIQALRAHGEVVAMTGDGVNDAPALQAADVGIAMGRGTDVAREAAGLVLIDDSLAAVLAAIRTGRTIYDNLRKVSTYLLAVHVPIAALALLPPLLGWPLLLDPVHIVLLELVIDPTCSIVFEREPPAADVMSRPPRGRREHLFEARRIVAAVLLGIAALGGPLATLAVTHQLGLAAGASRTLAFTALIAADLALVIAARGRLRNHGARNPATPWLFAAVSALVAATVVVPPVRRLFGFAAVAPLWLVVAVLAGVVPVLGFAAIARYSRTVSPASGTRTSQPNVSASRRRNASAAAGSP
ncbi:MAG TPA: cation-translocating P-type ATPase [Kofleriaceae bacterium]|nr:cation-translocating P-type ATPase [Kofleriaceae bacterium]